MISNLEEKSTHDVSESLFAIFNNSVNEIRNLAGQVPDNIVESVHLIRKRLKFLRAFVKLTQFCSEKENYKPINYILRDCGRTISDCRDAHVRGLILDELSQDKSICLLIEGLAELNDGLTKKIEHDLFSGINVFNELVGQITDEQVIQYFDSMQPDADCLVAGYALGYHKSYHAFHSGLVSHKADLLHEWRKRTKDLQYQQEALIESIPDQLTPSYEQVASLCEVLGRINDLFMFLEWLDLIDDSVDNQNQLSDLKNMLDEELQGLGEQANTDGKLLFTLSPKEYSQTLSKEMDL